MNNIALYFELNNIKNIMENNTAEAMRKLNAVLSDLQKDIYQAEAKKGGAGKRLKAAERILKSGKASGREALGYAKTVDGEQYICDAYRLVRFGADSVLPLPECPQNIDYPINIIRSFDKVYNTVIALPDRDRLAGYIKMQKATHKGERGYKPMYDFGAYLPVVDAQFLLDIMDIFPDAVFSVNASREETNTSFLHFESSCGEALLCPMRPSAGVPRGRTILCSEYK